MKTAQGFHKRFPLFARLAACGLILVLIASACQVERPSPTANPAVPSQTIVLPTQLADTETPSPTLTAAPMPLSVYLLAPDQADPALKSLVEPWLAQKAGESDLAFQTAASLSAADLQAHPGIVVALDPLPDLAELVSGAPGTSFITVGVANPPSAPNLSALLAKGSTPDEAGFLAGFIAATNTPDWRVGILTLNTSEGTLAQQGFTNGTVYFCGLCRPVYPPYYDNLGNYMAYPAVASVAPGASDAEQQAAADYLISQAVETVYVYPGAASPATLAYLAQAGVLLMGSESPLSASPELRSSWVVTLQANPLPALEQAWANAMAGSGGEISYSLTLSDANPSLFSPGKQALAAQTLQDIQAGLIQTAELP